MLTASKAFTTIKRKGALRLLDLIQYTQLHTQPKYYQNVWKVHRIMVLWYLRFSFNLIIQKAFFSLKYYIVVCEKITLRVYISSIPKLSLETLIRNLIWHLICLVLYQEAVVTSCSFSVWDPCVAQTSFQRNIYFATVLSNAMHDDNGIWLWYIVFHI